MNYINQSQEFSCPQDLTKFLNENPNVISQGITFDQKERTYTLFFKAPVPES